MRRAKIVCTIGPASRSPEKLAELIAAGMDVARLNFSHGKHEEHGEVIRQLRRLAAEANRNLAILLDLSGPKIRLGELREPVMLKTGDTIELTTEKIIGEGMLLPVSYPHFLEEVSAGDRISMADGLIHLEIVKKTATRATAKVRSNGPISSHKGINIPLGGNAIPAMTEKDADVLERLPEAPVLVGEGARVHAEALRAARPAATHSRRSSFLAATAGLIAEPLLTRGDGVHPRELRPLYLRGAHLFGQPPA